MDLELAMSGATCRMFGGQAARTCKRLTCNLRSPQACPAACCRCCRNDCAHARYLHSTVQTSCRQRAAPAAPSLSFVQRCALSARLAVARSRERKRKAQTEGKRKGPARLRPPTLSARGLGAAPHLRRRVPCGSRFAIGAGRLRVPLPMRCALMRWGFRHGTH